MIYDCIIIGSGPAGMTAAIYGARADMNVLLLDKLSPGGQVINTNEVQNYPGMDTINGAELAMKMYEHVSVFPNVTFDYRTVKKIENEGKTKKVYCEEDDMVFEGYSVIVASGTRPRSLHVPNEGKYAGHGVSWCAICDGAQYRDKDVVVIGGGNSAVEESIFLAGIVHHLTIVTMIGLTADPIACDKLRAMGNVTVYEYQDVLGFTEKDGHLAGVEFVSNKEDKTQRTVECDGVFEYIGLTPTTEYLKEMDILEPHGYVETDMDMHTKIDGIFGAGDCTSKHIRQIITASNDGAIAALEASHYVKRIK